MTAQSWVETTLPPGYSGYAASWSFGIMYGFSTGAVTLERWITEAERNRSAWRHWTAAVLRGRYVEWEECCDMPDMEDRQIECGTAIVQYHRAFGGWMVARVAFRVDHMATTEISRHRNDVDEAMARFAALVLATEGPQ